MDHRRMLRSTRTRAAAAAAALVLIMIASPAAATSPPQGARLLSVQATQAQSQTYDQAFTAAQGQGMSYQSVLVNWSDLEPSPNTYDYSRLTAATSYYPGKSTSVELRINPIYTCSRAVPSDLTSTAWDSSTMMSRFHTVLLGVYNATHPSGQPALQLTYLSLGTEVDSTLKYGWSDGSSIDYYMKYKTFFEDARAYARSLWGTGLQVGLSSTWKGLTSTTPESSSNATSTANSGQNHLTFTTAPGAFNNGDYVTIDYGQTGAETRRITSGAGTTNWTLDANLATTHTAGYWVARTLGNGVQTLNTNSDLVLYSYYGINDDFSVKDPTTAPYVDFWAAATMYPTRVLALDEVGYPTSSTLGSSDTMQKTFVQSVFGAWDQYCESTTSCNTPSLKYVDFQWGTDWSDDTAAHYAYVGCNGNAPPHVSTTSTNSASAGQAHLTFTSAPSGFANGDVVILDAIFGGKEEPMVISSGAGTTNWTMTANTAYAHGAGYEVLLKTLHAPTVTPTGGTGSNTWKYYVTAYNSNGDSLPSLEKTITNGVATLSSSAYNAISWSSVPGASGYRVFRSGTGTGSPSSLGWIADSTGTSLNDTGLTGHAYTNYTLNLKEYIHTLGYRTWTGSGTDKLGWTQMCSEAKARGWSTRATC